MSKDKDAKPRIYDRQVMTAGLHRAELLSNDLLGNLAKQVFHSKFILTGRQGAKPSPIKANLAKARDAKPWV